MAFMPSVLDAGGNGNAYCESAIRTVSYIKRLLRYSSNALAFLATDGGTEKLKNPTLQIYIRITGEGVQGLWHCFGDCEFRPVD